MWMERNRRHGSSYAYTADFRSLAKLLLLVEFQALLTNTPSKKTTEIKSCILTNVKYQLPDSEAPSFGNNKLRQTTPCFAINRLWNLVLPAEKDSTCKVEMRDGPSGRSFLFLWML